MQEPCGELVGLDFYKSRGTTADIFREVVDACLAFGARLGDCILRSQFDGARHTPFGSIYDSPVSVADSSPPVIHAALIDPHVRVAKVPVWGAIGLSPEVPEVITYNVISSEALGRDCHPIAILGEGWRFSTPGYEQQARTDGQKCVRSFSLLCGSLLPDYAAILNEESLPCKVDLNGESGRRCFRNFFVNRTSVGESGIRAIKEMYRPHLFIETDFGLFVYTSVAYNLHKGKMAIDEALDRSVRVAELLAFYLRTAR
jgi:hypothetical protein